MRLKQTIVTFMAVAAMLGPATADAYEEVTVVDGGTLSGRITLTGEVPRPKGYNLVTYPDPVYCGRISDGRGWRLLQSFRVGREGGLKDVVVLIEQVPQGKAFPASPPPIEAVDCTFKPFVTVVRDRQAVQVVNMDPVMHDIQAYETSQLGPRVLFNVPLPMNPLHPRDLSAAAQYHRHLPGEPVTQIVNMTKGRRVFVMQCGFHAYMESWGLAVDNPYYAVTGEDGRFEIGNVPPGTYQVLVWHPQIGEAGTYTVTIEPRGTAVLDAQIQAPTGRLYANEAMDNPRFGLGIMGDVRIVPTLEKQTY